jgi:hypothetical protein
MTGIKVALINLALLVLIIGGVFVVPGDMPLRRYFVAWWCAFAGINIHLFAKRRAEKGKLGYQPGVGIYIALGLVALATIFPYLVEKANQQHGTWLIQPQSSSRDH